MKHRILVSLGVLAAAAVFATLPLLAQTQPAGQTGSAKAAQARGPKPAAARPWKVPRTPWGDPDLQGIWTVNDMHGVPFERPANLAGATEVTAAEAAARQERATQASIWGYDREWRDTAPGFIRTQPSRQVAMVLDPSDGRVPPLTADGKKRAAERAARGSGLIEGSSEELRPGLWVDDLSPYVRCITRGVPEVWMPMPYNNGVQIVQGPGYVVVQNEMIHEARVIPLGDSADVESKLTQWLGVPRGRWDGDTLVVESTNFNGKAAFRGASTNLRLTERYTRVDRDTIQIRVTIDDPETWTRPWMFGLDVRRDDEQYELVEYSCHEGNYSLANILNGARKLEKEAAEAAPKSPNR